jgi:acyl-CoA thioesterase I
MKDVHSNSHRIVCMGDSLTEGYDIRTGSSWPFLLDKTTKHNFINSGICGDTTAGMLARFREMVIVHEPDYVIIMGGTNDISFNISDNQIVSNIKSMTRLARHHNIQSVIGIPPPFFLPGMYDDLLFIGLPELKNRLLEFDVILRRYIESDNQPTIDFTVGMKQEYYLHDGLHPNEKGHNLMAENVMIQLSDIF